MHYPVEVAVGTTVRDESSPSGTKAEQRAGELAKALQLQLARMELLSLVLAIAHKYGVGLYELCGRKRTVRLSHARHEVWHFLYHARDDLSYPDLASLFDRDHSTVRYGVLTHEQRLQEQLLANQEPTP